MVANLIQVAERKKYTALKTTINNRLINFQDLEHNDLEFVQGEPYELFIVDDLGIYFDFDSDFQDYTTNNGDGDINWTMEEYFLTKIAFIQDFTINDNPIFEEGRVNLPIDLQGQILKIANEKYYRTEER